MNAFSDDAAHRVLDLVNHGPSSVAALYASLIHTHEGFSTTPPMVFLTNLREILRKGWVSGYLHEPGRPARPATDEDWEKAAQAYSEVLPDISIDVASFDQVGFWIEITDPGRREWDLWAAAMKRGRP